MSRITTNQTVLTITKALSKTLIVLVEP